MIGKTDKELEDMLYKTKDNRRIIDRTLSGMTYAEGVEAALEWVIGQREEPPVDDDDCDESRS